ncbi:MAG: GNAT family N-acetyltransferase [Chloroflexi bacterium]|nr:GNAT family N-acetyltransferase [Chloroflexota bacterium]
MEPQVLDNPVWHMLCHDLAGFAVGTARAKRCDPAVVPLAALADYGASALEDLGRLVRVKEVISLYALDPPQEIPGFESRARFPVDQLVCQRHTPVPQCDGYNSELVELTSDDVQDMTQLLRVSGLGSLRPALIDRGRFVGIRQEGALVAMAGERMHLPGYCEVAAVCTHPDWRGRGYAKFVTAVIAEGIWARGKTPFLHVLAHNTPAQHAYQALNFVKQGELTYLMLARR